MESKRPKEVKLKRFQENFGNLVDAYKHWEMIASKPRSPHRYMRDIERYRRTEASYAFSHFYKLMMQHEKYGDLTDPKLIETWDKIKGVFKTKLIYLG